MYLGESPKNLRRPEHGVAQGERRGRVAVRVRELLRPQDLLPRGLGVKPAGTSVEHPSLEEPDHGGASGFGIIDAGALQSEAPSLPQVFWDRSALFLQLVAAQGKGTLHLLAAAKTSHLADARGLPEPCHSAQKNGVFTGRHPDSVIVVVLTLGSRRKIFSAEHVWM